MKKKKKCWKYFFPCFHEGGGVNYSAAQNFFGGKNSKTFFFPTFFLQKYFVFLTSFPFFFFIVFDFSFFNYQYIKVTPPSPRTHILPGGLEIRPRSYRFRPFPQRRGSEKYGRGPLITFNKFYLTFYYFFCYFCFHSGKKFNKKAVKSQMKSIRIFTQDGSTKIFLHVFE